MQKLLHILCPQSDFSLWYFWALDALLSPDSCEMLCACAYMLLDCSYLSGKVRSEAKCLVYKKDVGILILSASKDSCFCLPPLVSGKT